jgi:hypothetical protein
VLFAGNPVGNMLTDLDGMMQNAVQASAHLCPFRKAFRASSAAPRLAYTQALLWPATRSSKVQIGKRNQLQCGFECRLQDFTTQNLLSQNPENSNFKILNSMVNLILRQFLYFTKFFRDNKCG